jgi:hypothetical protein
MVGAWVALMVVRMADESAVWKAGQMVEMTADSSAGQKGVM